MSPAPIEVIAITSGDDLQMPAAAQHLQRLAAADALLLAGLLEPGQIGAARVPDDERHDDRTEREHAGAHQHQVGVADRLGEQRA